MLAIGETISRDLQLWITALTIIIMVGGLTPRFWRRRRAPGARR